MSKAIKPTISEQAKQLRRMSDLHKATLFLFLIKRGLPPWAKGMNQPLALVAMTGWSLERANVALNQSVKAGYADIEM